MPGRHGRTGTTTWRAGRSARLAVCGGQSTRRTRVRENRCGRGLVRPHRVGVTGRLALGALRARGWSDRRRRWLGFRLGCRGRLWFGFGCRSRLWFGGGCGVGRGLRRRPRRRGVRGRRRGRLWNRLRSRLDRLGGGRLGGRGFDRFGGSRDRRAQGEQQYDRKPSGGGRETDGSPPHGLKLWAPGLPIHGALDPRAQCPVPGCAVARWHVLPLVARSSQWEGVRGPVRTGVGRLPATAGGVRAHRSRGQGSRRARSTSTPPAIVRCAQPSPSRHVTVSRSASGAAAVAYSRR